MSSETSRFDGAAPRPVILTAHVRQHAYCAVCGWPVILTYCSDGMAQTPPYSGWIAWTYCTNKTCKHHDGDGVFHNMPAWIKSSHG